MNRADCADFMLKEEVWPESKRDVLGCTVAELKDKHTHNYPFRVRIQFKVVGINVYSFCCQL